jgi:predicted nucleic acid-binding protein
MSNIIVVYDACVLYPAPLRDLLVRLARIGLFHAKWTDTIHDEWIRNVLEDRSDLTRERLERTRDLMNANVLDCLVQDYEHLISTISLPDENDRHVLAAAIQAQAQVIVTFNLKDFPKNAISRYGIEALHPDVFVDNLLNMDEELVCTAVRSQRLNLKNPLRSAEELLATFTDQGLKRTVKRLRSLIDLL